MGQASWLSKGQQRQRQRQVFAPHHNKRLKKLDAEHLELFKSLEPLLKLFPHLPPIQQDLKTIGDYIDWLVKLRLIAGVVCKLVKTVGVPFPSIARRNLTRASRATPNRRYCCS